MNFFYKLNNPKIAYILFWALMVMPYVVGFIVVTH